MSCPTGQEGSNLNGEQYGQFFSCKYAVASNPIRIRLKFSGHKFTIIYSRLDVVNKTGKIHLIHMVSHNYCIPLYHPTLFPPFFTAFHHPQKINLITTKFSMWMTILQQPTKKVVILEGLRKLPPSLIKSTPVHLAAHLIAVTKIPCAAGRSTP